CMQAAGVGTPAPTPTANVMTAPPVQLASSNILNNTFTANSQQANAANINSVIPNGASAVAAATAGTAPLVPPAAHLAAAVVSQPLGPPAQVIGPNRATLAHVHRDEVEDELLLHADANEHERAGAANYKDAARKGGEDHAHEGEDDGDEVGSEDHDAPP